MTDRESALERLRKAAQNAKAAAGKTDSPQSGNAAAEKIREAAYDKAMGHGFARNFKDGIEFLGKTARTAKAAFDMAAGVWGAMERNRFFQYIPRGINGFYHFAAYRKKPDGTREWSPTRSAFAVAAIGLGVWYGSGWAMRTSVGAVTGFIGASAEFAYDATMIAVMSGQETVYLQTPLVVRGGNNPIYEVGGCDNYPCTKENSFTYRIRDSYFLDFLEWVNLRNLSFYPDQVKNAIPAAGGKCDVKYWGFRYRFVRRNTNWFPVMYDISCDTILPEQRPQHLEHH